VVRRELVENNLTLGRDHASLFCAINAERRRIERDLHNGTQGRLVSVAMSLGLMDAKLPGDPSAAKPIAREARRAPGRALEELRELSRGLHPRALTERGLAGALQELAERSALPAYVELSIDPRPPARVEAVAYFAVSGALANAAKHSHAREVRIAVSYEEPVLIAEVVDDGMGGAAAGPARACEVSPTGWRRSPAA
jgi:signal transduction histidine kinase